MTTVIKNVDLASGSPSIQGWETCAAGSDNVVIMTGNYFAAFSTNAGDTFSSMDPNGICNAWGETFCCDQLVIYCPQVDQFVWILQTASGNYILAFASPERVRVEGGRFWVTSRILAKTFDPTRPLDRPSLAYGPSFLYITANIVGRCSIGIRVPWSSIFNALSGKALSFSYFLATTVYWLKAVSYVNYDIGLFVAESSSSGLRVLQWFPDGRVNTFDVPIATISTEGWDTSIPNGGVWLGPSSKIDWQVQSATWSGSQLWATWAGARRVAGSAGGFNFPHIGIAVIDVFGRHLVSQRYIWNPDFAFTWPSIAANLNGNVALSYCWGGNTRFPEYGVAMLTGANQSFLSVTAEVTNGSGGHYTSIARHFPNQQEFCAAGFVQVTDPGGAPINRPRYVRFGE